MGRVGYLNNNNLVFLIALLAGASLFNGSAQAQTTTHVVGDSLGWVVPSGGSAAYTTWAANKRFTVGDTLVFNFTTGAHTVAEVTRAAFDSCNTSAPISISTNGPSSIVLRTAGPHYYICTIPMHCSMGQKLAINNVSAATTATPPSSSSPVPHPSGAPVQPPLGSEAPTPSPMAASRVYTVGDTLGWTVPAAAPAAYQNWAANKIFRAGDVLVFNFANGRHDVAEVTKAAYDSCNTSSPLSTVTTSPARITLDRSGPHYYICTFQGHCSAGQKLAINVTSSGASVPSASGPTTNPSTPSPTSPPPGDSAAPSVVASVGLPLTLLSIALALLR